MIRITVFNEFVHEKEEGSPSRAAYPNGIHMALKEVLSPNEDFQIRTATLDDSDCGLPQSVLDETDVLIWWGHVKHNEVPDDVVNRVTARVLQGMGFIPLHSGHMSRPFMKLMGTTCDLRWRENDERERLWVVSPGHPIAKGLPTSFEIPREETYGEYFDIPAPQEIVFLGWFSGGEVFRSGCCFTRGAGRIFYFQPGHETNRTYYIPEVVTVIANAVRWAAPAFKSTQDFGWHEALEK